MTGNNTERCTSCLNYFSIYLWSLKLLSHPPVSHHSQTSYKPSTVMEHWEGGCFAMMDYKQRSNVGSNLMPNPIAQWKHCGLIRWITISKIFNSNHWGSPRNCCWVSEYLIALSDLYYLSFTGSGNSLTARLSEHAAACRRLQSNSEQSCWGA